MTLQEAGQKFHDAVMRLFLLIADKLGVVRAVARISKRIG